MGLVLPHGSYVNLRLCSRLKESQIDGTFKVRKWRQGHSKFVRNSWQNWKQNVKSSKITWMVWWDKKKKTMAAGIRSHAEHFKKKHVCRENKWRLWSHRLPRLSFPGPRLPPAPPSQTRSPSPGCRCRSSSSSCRGAKPHHRARQNKQTNLTINSPKTACYKCSKAQPAPSCIFHFISQHRSERRGCKTKLWLERGDESGWGWRRALGTFDSLC